MPPTTIGVYRPSNATFYLKSSNTGGAADITAQYGAQGDIPIVGDWDGNGTTTIGVYRPSNATFYLKSSNTGGAADITAQYGAQGDIPIVGDWRTPAAPPPHDDAPPYDDVPYDDSGGA